MAGASGATDASASLRPLAGYPGLTADGALVEGEAIVKFASRPSLTELQVAAVGIDAVSLEPLEVSNAYVAELRKGQTVQEAVAELSARSDVLYAEPNYIYRAASIPNDTEFRNLWGLHNTDELLGTLADADIDAPEAWDETAGSPDVVVAVIDSGVAYDHPDLDGNIWSNTDEIAGNGIDDDANGYVDDVRGWDFVQGDAEPLDFDGHGTHVAGTIGAEGNNAKGITGVNQDVAIMPVRGLDADGDGTNSGLAQAVAYACANGAHVINDSWGGPAASQLIYDAFAACPGVLHVVAAGNNGQGLDGDGSNFPCEYDGPDSPFGALVNIVCVGSSNPIDTKSGFSNHGAESVHLFAPGEEIRSSYPTRSLVAPIATFDPTITGWTGGGNPNTWGRAERPSASNGSASDSPAGNYANNTDNTLQRDGALSLAGRRGCSVEYQLSLDAVAPNDGLLVQAAPSGSTATTLAAWSGISGGFVSQLHDLSAFDGTSAVLFRFVFVSDATGVADGAYVDDVAFRCLEPSGELYAWLSGTSMAAPHVAGVAALYFARFPAKRTRTALTSPPSRQPSSTASRQRLRSAIRSPAAA